MNNICPKCKKGQTVCTYLELLPPGAGYYRYYGWRHDCTNPACGFNKMFRLEEVIANRKENLPYLGPGKEGCCPGPHE